jgi:hypothetical protein
MWKGIKTAALATVEAAKKGLEAMSEFAEMVLEAIAAFGFKANFDIPGFSCAIGVELETEARVSALRALPAPRANPLQNTLPMQIGDGANETIVFEAAAKGKKGKRSKCKGCSSGAGSTCEVTATFAFKQQSGAGKGSWVSATIIPPSLKLKLTPALEITVEGECENSFSVDYDKDIPIFKYGISEAALTIGLSLGFKKGISGSVTLTVPIEFYLAGSSSKGDIVSQKSLLRMGSTSTRLACSPKSRLALSLSQ